MLKVNDSHNTLSKRQQCLANCWAAVNANDWYVAGYILKAGARRYGRRLFPYRLKLMITNGVWDLDYTKELYYERII